MSDLEWTVFAEDADPVPISWQRAHVVQSGSEATFNRVVVNRGVPGVVVLARLAGSLAFVRVRRPAVGRALYELPRGFGTGDPGADASREFWEETGHEALSTVKLGEFVLDSGLVPTPIWVFLIESRPADQGPTIPDRDEVDELAWVPEAEVGLLVARGEISDGITLAALAMWQAQDR